MDFENLCMLMRTPIIKSNFVYVNRGLCIKTDIIVTQKNFHSE
jgi:hypothetical protein